MLKTAVVGLLVVLLVSGCSISTQRVSDSDVESNVEKALASMQDVNPDQVDVESENGDVTLTGRVDSVETRDRVGQIVGVVEGVDKVNNNLEIAPSQPGGVGAGPSQRTGRQQEQEVRSLLKRYNALNGVNMNIKTANGVVTLSGTVPNQSLKDQIGSIMREQEGVKSVRNNLQVK